MTLKTARILWIDDNITAYDDVILYLHETPGYEVVVGAQSSLLDSLRKEVFDLLILDIMIRTQGLNEGENIHYNDINWKFTGIEFLKRFRAGEYSSPTGGTQPETPVIILSAISNPSEVIPDNIPGDPSLTTYLEKAGDPNELISTIQNSLEKRLHA